MTTILRLLPVMIALVALGPNLQAQERTKARLVLAAGTARAGDTVLAGVELSMPPKWHTYWRNAGDSGMPTKIDWQLPNGISAGPVQWPVPEKYTAADLTSYTYHDTVMLLTPLRISPDAPPGKLDIKAKVSWLECEEICLPGKSEVQASLTIASESKPSEDATLIESWQKKLPSTALNSAVKVSWEKTTAEDTRSIVIEWEAGANAAEVDFFPYSGDEFEIGGATERLSRAGNKVALRKTVKKLGQAWPQQIQGVLVTKTAAGAPAQASEVTLALGGAVPAGGEVSPTPTAAPVAPKPPQKSLWTMLVLAFLGGLILNIMPCVLPVIALKILGFVQQSKEEPHRVRQLGLIYAMGVLVSFLVLAGIVIGVQQAGRSANWGMQFQNPQFLLGMTMLVTLVALNLFGLFEVNLSGGAMAAASQLAYKEGGAGAFFNGILATALATPCTAPFLAPALGYAFTQPPGITVLMFLTVGCGLAAPYVLLSWQPKWLVFLPKPGAWMESFKIVMGFPMLATAVWLASLTAGHFGNNGMMWLGLFLVVLAMAAWIWGQFVQRARYGRGFAAVTCLILVAAGYGFILEKELAWRSPKVAATSNSGPHRDPNGIAWQPWSAKAVEEARAAGHPVLVDFTADWCLICQVNKKTSLEIASVRAKLKQINAVSLLGDHTREDPAITEELRKHERAGVPLVLVYPADPSAAPYVLPEVLTPDIVLEYLNKAAESKMTARAE